jgi:hypothetical protein
LIAHQDKEAGVEKVADAEIQEAHQEEAKAVVQGHDNTVTE